MPRACGGCDSLGFFSARFGLFFFSFRLLLLSLSFFAHPFSLSVLISYPTPFGLDRTRTRNVNDHRTQHRRVGLKLCEKQFHLVRVRPPLLSYPGGTIIRQESVNDKTLGLVSGWLTGAAILTGGRFRIGLGPDSGWRVFGFGFGRLCSASGSLSRAVCLQ